MGKLNIWGDFEKKIVCNELRRQDLISVSDWIHDASDCMARFSPVTYQGYRLWAVPCLQLIRKHESLARSLAIVVRWMVADIKHQKGLSTKPHYLGRMIRLGVFWPGNWLLGKVASMSHIKRPGLVVASLVRVLGR